MPTILNKPSILFINYNLREFDNTKMLLCNLKLQFLVVKPICVNAAFVSYTIMSGQCVAKKQRILILPLSRLIENYRINFQNLSKKSSLPYTRLIPFRVLRVRAAQLRGFAPGSTHQGCSGGESLQRFADLIGSGFECHTSRTRSRPLST